MKREQYESLIVLLLVILVMVVVSSGILGHALTRNHNQTIEQIEKRCEDEDK
jgi:hypothetical protein